MQSSSQTKPNPYDHAAKGLSPNTRNVEFFCDLKKVSWSQFPGLNECNPGMDPTEYNCIVAIYEVPERVGSILLPDQERQDAELAMQFGRLIKISPLAFSYEEWPSDARKPQVGDIVWIARYAGGMLGGLDGRPYRILKDKDIGGVIPYVGEGEEGA